MKTLTLTIVALGVLAGSASAERPPRPDFSTNRTMEIEPFEVVPFGIDSIEMDSIDRAQLQEAVTWLRAHPDYRLVVEGHADAVGSAEYNDWLSRLRATVVFDALVKLGAPRDRVVETSFGESLANERVGAARRAAVVYAQRRK